MSNLLDRLLFVWHPYPFWCWSKVQTTCRCSVWAVGPLTIQYRCDKCYYNSIAQLHKVIPFRKRKR